VKELELARAKIAELEEVIRGKDKEIRQLRAEIERLETAMQELQVQC